MDEQTPSEALSRNAKSSLTNILRILVSCLLVAAVMAVWGVWDLPVKMRDGKGTPYQFSKESGASSGDFVGIRMGMIPFDFENSQGANVSAPKKTEIPLPELLVSNPFGSQIVRTGSVLYLDRDGSDLSGRIRLGNGSATGWDFEVQVKWLTLPAERTENPSPSPLAFGPLAGWSNPRTIVPIFFKDVEKVEMEIRYLLENERGKKIVTEPFRVTVFPDGKVKCDRLQLAN